MENLFLNVILLSPFVGQGFPNQNNTWTIISFICALILQHNARLGYKQSSFQNFSENYFLNFYHDA
jgi:hypothetical protein